MPTKPPKKRTYNGKGDPRCLGDAGLRPEQIVPPAVYKALGRRFRKTRGRMDRRVWKTGAMQVRCYWYRIGPGDGDGGPRGPQMIPQGQITKSRIVDKVEYVPGYEAQGWIRGWVIWAGEYVEIRKFMGERYWKMLRLLGEGERRPGYYGKGIWKGIGAGRPIAWDGPCPAIGAGNGGL